MKSKILVLVVVLAVLAGGYYVVFVQRKGVSVKDTTEGTTAVVEDEESEGGSFTGTLKAAVAMGVPMKCKYEVEGMEYEGLLKGKKFKGQVKMPDGKVGMVVMIDNCLYTWSNEEAQGIKMCFDEEEESIWDSTGGDTPDGYVCRPAVILDSEFDLPSDIEFMDLEALMQGQGIVTE